MAHGLKLQRSRTRLIHAGILGGAALLVGPSACTVTSTGGPGDAGAGQGADGGGGDAQAPGRDGGDAAATSTLGFTPSNVDLSGMDLSNIGAFVANTNKCTLNSEHVETTDCASGAAEAVAFKVMAQSDGSKIGVYVAKSFRVETGATLVLTGLFPIVLVALDKIEIQGGVVAAAKGDVAECGGFTQTTTNTKGGGPGGGGAASTSTAAGGGSYCGVGGAGAVESGTAATGGPAFGAAAISPLVGGASGGGGTVGGGGAGGGAVQLVAANSVTIAAGAHVHAGGGGGSFGGASGGQEASGGGSGGAILIESLVVTVAGVLAVNGGGGGEGALGNSGSNATPDDKAALGGRDPVRGSDGGNGSAAASVNGTDGAVKAGSTAGGGGGGAGRIRINTKSGMAALTGATLSPAATTPCATQGMTNP